MKAMSRALIPVRIVKQVFLVILLRVPPHTSWLNDSGDLLPFRIKILLLDTRRYLFGDLKLLGGVGKDARAIL